MLAKLLSRLVSNLAGRGTDARSPLPGATDRQTQSPADDPQAEFPPVAELNRLFAAYQEGRHAEVELSASRIVGQYPDSGMSWLLLGVSLHVQGKNGLNALRNAVRLMPDAATAHTNLGIVLRANGLLGEAIDCFRRACELQPESDDTHCNLGSALQIGGRLEEATGCFLQALQINPGNAMARNNLGLAEQTMGRIDAARDAYRTALAIKPGFAECYSNLLFLEAFHATLPPASYLDLARKWELACVPATERAAARSRVFRRSSLAGRRLRVGYLSGHFRRHPVSENIEQLFAAHDRSNVQLFAYSVSRLADAVTERLRASVEHWVPAFGMTEPDLRDRIDADGIDVLVDLGGHTEENRLGVFARRAAPVQTYYLGYFASTGLSEMDYLIGDRVVTPPALDAQFSERVWRLPRVWQCYNHANDAPEPDWRPARDGSVCLGSFNNLGKLTPSTFETWAEVLHALPEATLLLKTKELSLQSNCDRVIERMSGLGIAPRRIVLRDGTDTPGWRDHMGAYDRLDIALDPVEGMSGGITTCDALWMGVPVVAYAGDRMSSRISAAILDAVGHPEWIASSRADYIGKVVSLARDLSGRTQLRAGQRERVRSSALCDAPGLARELETAYRQMFLRWHEGQSAA